MMGHNGPSRMYSLHAERKHGIVNYTPCLAESRSLLDYCPACLTHRSPLRGGRRNEGVENGATLAAHHRPPVPQRVEVKLWALS
ncbi:hypothetical protein E2C01_083325 [Portunus trituberculatus]|uniref:Uncharacterized protein n=1 Tax=Portunus trituberculatus TaxID=210409 RepID=A0A5B7J1P8_PORTR|nr:hypothetical protein [Portunus trituberculatus]